MPLDETKLPGDFGHLGDHDALHERYNDSVPVLSGTAAARPAAGAVEVGTLYWATDTSALSRSTGAAWEALAAGATDHGGLAGLADDDHPQYATDTDLTNHAGAADPHAGYVLNAELTSHEGAADPHTGYRLESADHSHASAGLQAGTIDHGALTGLADDDHTQYIAKAIVDAKGDIIAATAADAVSRLAVGANGTVLTAASGQATGLQWAAAAGGGPAYVFANSNTPVSIASTTDVEVVSRNITVAATQIIEVEVWGLIHNNSGAARTYIATIDFDDAFDAELHLWGPGGGAHNAHATERIPVRMSARCHVHSSSLAEAILEGSLIAQHSMASGNDTGLFTTSSHDGLTWGTTTSDLTGTCTVKLKLRSSAATATQTFAITGLTITVLSQT